VPRGTTSLQKARFLYLKNLVKTFLLQRLATNGNSSARYFSLSSCSLQLRQIAEQLWLFTEAVSLEACRNLPIQSAQSDASF